MAGKPNPSPALDYLPVPSLQPSLQHPNCLLRDRAALVIWSLLVPTGLIGNGLVCIQGVLEK